MYDDVIVPPVPPIEALLVEKSDFHHQPAMAIDQSTVEGNSRIIQGIFEKTLQLAPDWFDSGKKVMIGGDQLTTSRLESLQNALWTANNSFDRMNWIAPVM